MAFSGIYPNEDIEFLLNPIQMQMTSIAEKERLIQSGEKHYSEMLSEEPEPSADHIHIYKQALAQYELRVAKEVMQIAITLSEVYQNKPIILASLVRAGVPLGVLLKRALNHLNHPCFHYGISIIRDKGLDAAAMDFIETKHGKEAIVFVDGWTGKGAISKQLATSLKARGGYPILPRLVVLADIYGSAWLSASKDDWLIPFGILGAPISGLVSRSIWLEDSFHGAVLCNHLSAFACSNEFIDAITLHFSELAKSASLFVLESDSNRITTVGLSDSQRSDNCDALVLGLKNEYQIDKINRIKPGIAEATRAVLRRVPEHILVRNKFDPDVSLLMHLAKEKNITVIEKQEAIFPYRAITIIKKVS